MRWPMPAEPCSTGPASSGRASTSWRPELEGVLRDAGDDWRAGALAVFSWMAAQQELHGCAFVQAEVEVGDRVPAVRELAVRHKRAFVRALRDHLKRAGVDGPDELAEQLQLLMEGATARTLLDGDPGHVARARRGAALLLDAAERGAG